MPARLTSKESQAAQVADGGHVTISERLAKPIDLSPASGGG
jgi:ribosomal 50S subunit-recycling heat shock protein